MNRTCSDPPPVAEADWLAQEQSLASPASPADALLAQALRSLPAGEPPRGFAGDVARRAAATAMRSGEQARVERMEQALLATLLLAMVVAVGVVLAWYGPRWWILLHAMLGEGGAAWALGGAACLLLSWLPEGARRLRQSRTAPV